MALVDHGVVEGHSPLGLCPSINNEWALALLAERDPFISTCEGSHTAQHIWM